MFIYGSCLTLVRKCITLYILIINLVYVVNERNRAFEKNKKKKKKYAVKLKCCTLYLSYSVYTYYLSRRFSHHVVNTSG